MDTRTDVGAGADGGGKGIGGTAGAVHLEGSTQDPKAAQMSVMVPAAAARAGDQGTAGGDGTRPPISAQQLDDLQRGLHRAPEVGVKDAEEGTNGRDGGAGSNGGEGKDKQRDGGAGKSGHSNGGEGKDKQRDGCAGKEGHGNGGEGKDKQRDGGVVKNEQNGNNGSYYTAVEDEQQQHGEEGEARSTASSRSGRSGGRGVWGMLDYAAQLAYKWGEQWLHKVDDEGLRTAMGADLQFLETVARTTVAQSQMFEMAQKTASLCRITTI